MILQLPSALRSFLAIRNGVATSIGMETAINNVCNCTNAMESAIPLAVPTNIERKLPAHVGHAMNNPAAAPIVLTPLPFFEIAYALIAIEVLRPTKYETII